MVGKPPHGAPRVRPASSGLPVLHDKGTLQAERWEIFRRPMVGLGSRGVA